MFTNGSDNLIKAAETRLQKKQNIKASLLS